MAGELADQAFGHCFVVLNDAAPAAEAALVALRRAGRSRSSVLAHARYQALERTDGMAPPEPETPVPDDLLQLAVLLAATRPAVERAVLDLRTRLDRAEFGRAIGLPAASAADRADAVGEAWDRELDPLLMAHLGPGDCLLLAAVLADAEPTPRPTLGQLVAMGPAVAAHVEGCEVCTDRHRAMVSVRALLAQADVPPTPDAVQDAARRSRRMRPAQAPPPLDPRPRRPLVIAAAVLAAIALLGGVAATAAALTGSKDGRAGRVAKLVRVPANGLALTIQRDVVGITNRSGRPVRWSASADAKWLEIRPADGRLAAGQAASLQTRVMPSSPEGALRTTITVTGDDGSAAAAVYETTIERAPDLATAINGCVVTATVEDSSGIRLTSLLWNDAAGAHNLQMSQDASGYTGVLPPATPLSWWVVAVDTRGNQARTPEAKVAC